MSRPKNRGMRCDKTGYCDFRRNFKGAPRTCTDRNSYCYKAMIADKQHKDE